MSETRQINLLQGVMGARLTERQVRRLLIGLSILTSFFLITISIVLFLVGRVYQERMGALVLDIGGIEEEIEDRSETEVIYRAVAEKLQASDRLLKIGSFPVLFFEEFVSLLPEDIAVSGLSLSGNSLTARLTTVSLFSLERFVQDLASHAEEKGKFTNIVVSSINQMEAGKYEVHLEAELRKEVP